MCVGERERERKRDRDLMFNAVNHGGYIRAREREKEKSVYFCMCRRVHVCTHNHEYSANNIQYTE